MIEIATTKSPRKVSSSSYLRRRKSHNLKLFHDVSSSLFWEFFSDVIDEIITHGVKQKLSNDNKKFM